MDPNRRRSPNLIFEETSAPCGFAPRTIYLESSEGAEPRLFVGCKDGTVEVLEPRRLSEGRHWRAGEIASGVRALASWDERTLIVARSDGSLDLLPWAPGEKGETIERTKQRVQQIVKMEAGAPEAASVPRWLLVGGGGLSILNGDGRVDEIEIGEYFDGRGRAIQPHPTLHLRIAVRFHGSKGDWLLVDDDGELWRWSEGIGRLRVEPQSGRRPGLILDHSREWVRDDEGRGVRALYLATDMGVFRVSGDSFQTEHVHVPAVASMVTALSYADDGGDNRYLWVTDNRGDSHLLWAPGPAFDRPGDGAGSSPDESRRFERSGIYHASSDVLQCMIWWESADQELFVGQARRDDRVFVGRYWRHEHDDETRLGPRSEPAPPTDGELRRLLQFDRFRGASGAAAIAQYLTACRAREAGGADEPREGAGADARRADGAGPEWLLVELFEYLAEDHGRRHVLLQSLRSPYADLADAVLREFVLTERPVAEKPTRIWTLALLDIIHRVRDDPRRAHVRLLRWLRGRQLELRRIEETPEGAQHAKSLETIRRQLDLDIRFANKWGLHGHAQVDREDLVRPIAILREQEARLRDSADGSLVTAAVRDERLRLSLDRLVLESFLFLRSVSRICDCGSPPTRGRTAWQIALHPPDGETSDGAPLVAVSWRWGGVEIHRFHRGGGDPVAAPQLERVDCLQATGAGDSGFVRTDPPTGKTSRTKYGYSHVVLFTEIGGTTYLLTAPTIGEDRHCLLLWRIEPNGRRCVVGDEPEVFIRSGEGIHCVLALGEEYLLLGLRGNAGRPQVSLVPVADLLEPSDDPLEVRFPPVCLDLPGRRSKNQAEGGPIHRNRIWSMARPDARREAPFEVIAGCESGDVLRFVLDTGDLERLGRAGAPEDPEDQETVPTTAIDRLRAPVVSIAASHHASGCVRVFAGGDDGTAMGWQMLPSRSGAAAPEAGTAPRFAPLWATAEAASVRNLLVLPVLEGSKDPHPMVLAVTIDGRCVLINDRFDYGETRRVEDHPRRINYPGSRHGRPSLGKSAYACRVIPTSWWAVPPITRELGATGLLLHASGDGRLQVSTLHTPSFTRERKDRLRDLARQWRTVVHDLTRLRIGGAVHASTPILSLVLVRWLLDPEPVLWAVPGAEGEGDLPLASDDPAGFFRGWLDGATKRWLPRYLQPLQELRRDFGSMLSHGEEPDLRVELVERTEQQLSDALERAWLLDDLDLFQEICEVVLKWWNWEIFRLGEIGDRTERERRAPIVQAGYAGIFRAIERMLYRWFGAGDRKEARARMLVAKHLVDGETLWQILRHAESSEPFREILRMRRRAVRELVYVRDPMVSLESLRAANLSLLRLCRLYSVERAGRSGRVEYFPGTHEGAARGFPGEAPWSVFGEWFEDLAAAAARSFRTPRQLDDAMAHEYSRTFALCVCACPSATLRMASRLTETQVLAHTHDVGTDGDLSHRVLQQIEMLRALGLAVPEWVDDLFRLGSQPPRTGVTDPFESFQVLALDPELAADGDCQCGEPSDPSEPTGCKGRFRLELAERDPDGKRPFAQPRCFGLLGKPNAEDLGGLRTLYTDVIAVFERAAERLSTDAREIDLSAETIARCLERLKKLPPSYADSKAFWRDEVLKKIGSATLEPRQRVPPRVVLNSRLLAVRCEEWSTELETWYRQGRIFEPERTIFQRVLDRLRIAADRFRFSAAVQKNMVEGVLGHHLLEDLDEHALELEEIVEVLDPLMVWDYRTNGRQMRRLPDREAATTAQSFGRYLLQRAIRAGEIPRNLRILLAMLGSPAIEGEREIPFDELYDRCGLAVERLQGEPAPQLDRREAQYLLLTLDELRQNDKKHGLGHMKEWHPRSRFAPGAALLEFFFEGGADDGAAGNHGRLAAEHAKGPLAFQAPADPLKDRDVASTGTGLYLANLSAALVGWRLRIDRLESVRADGPPISAVIFRLERTRASDLRNDPGEDRDD